MFRDGLQRRWCWLPLCVVTILTSSTVGGQEPDSAAASADKSRIVKQIREIIERSAKARKQRQLDRESHLERVKLLERQIARLKADKISVDAKLEQQRREISTLSRQTETNQAAITAARAWITVVIAKARPVAVRASQRIQNGLGPRQQSRLSAMQSAVGLMIDDNPQQAADGLRRFFTAISEEWLPARSVTLANQPVVLAAGREARHSWIVGFGFVSRFFVSEDGMTTGWRIHGNKPSWHTELDDESRQQVLDIVEIARERQPPRIVPIPLQLPAENSNE